MVELEHAADEAYCGVQHTMKFVCYGLQSAGGYHLYNFYSLQTTGPPLFNAQFGVPLGLTNFHSILRRSVHPLSVISMDVQYIG